MSPRALDMGRGASNLHLATLRRDAIAHSALQTQTERVMMERASMGPSLAWGRSRLSRGERLVPPFGGPSFPAPRGAGPGAGLLEPGSAPDTLRTHEGGRGRWKRGR